MGNCPSCSTPIPPNARFCPSCGRDVTDASGVSGTGPTPAQPVEVKTSGMAVASLILSFFFWLLLIPSVLAIIFGHIARGEIKRSRGKLKGDGLALAGLILGYLGGVGYILIIAAIAIPNLLRSRIAANEASAVSSLRTLNTSAITYASTYNVGYPKSLEVMGPSSGGNYTQDHAGLIDEVLASGLRSGYNFTYKVTATDAKGFPTAYSVNADPHLPGNTGQRYFFTDSSGVIRAERNHPSNKDSPPVM